MGRERRAPNRRTCNVPVTVYSDAVPVKCRVRDISPHGCQLRGPVFGLVNQVEVHFAEARLAVPGRVAWKTFEAAGIEFLATVKISGRDG